MAKATRPMNGTARWVSIGMTLLAAASAFGGLFWQVHDNSEGVRRIDRAINGDGQTPGIRGRVIGIEKDIELLLQKVNQP